MNVVVLRALRCARRHRLMACAVLAGAALRVIVQLTYSPALLYIDSPRYLYGESVYDPLGYLAMLWPLDRAGGLALVTAAQHLLGLAMAITIYAIALRRGARRWVAVLAAVPLLVDAYQLQVEQNIMADTMFEAAIVAGLAALLWRARPSARATAVAGLVLGVAALVREIGLVLILPAIVYVWLTTRAPRGGGRRAAPAGGWRRHPGLRHAALVCVAFTVPVAGYLGANFAATGRIQLAGDESDLYGRAAAAANCSTLRIPDYERPLCPAVPTARALGVDGLIHNPVSPGITFRAPSGLAAASLRAEFTHAVLLQQPFAVMAVIAADAGKSFGYPRTANEADTPISRWQFQTSYPAFPPSLTRAREARISAQFGGGTPTVIRPLAAALRAYQLHGGYAPGPALALAGLLGLAGAAGAGHLRPGGMPTGQPGRRSPRWPAGRPRGQSGGRRCPADAALRAGCFLVTATGLLVLVGADVIEFSWRYQLPGLVTLPLAGALGVTALRRAARSDASSDADDEPAGPGRSPARASLARPAKLRAPDPVR